jgi:succinoglycan biosynthesis protein ExoA
VPLPLVTIIVPCRNEARYLPRSLGSAVAQDYPTDRLEFVVADGLSEDGSGEIAHKILARSGHRFEVISNPERVTPIALNRCLERARGDVILYLIAHCELATDYVRRSVEILERTGADLVGGTIETRGRSTLGRAIALALSSRFGVGGVAFRTRPGHSGFVDTVALGAYRREVFERVGPFDPAFVRNQDAELSFRITLSGGRIWLDSALRSTYHSRPSLRALWRQHFNTGASKVQILAKHRRLPALRHYIPGAFVLGAAATVAAALILRQPWVALTVLGPYGLVLVAAATWTTGRDLRLWPLVAAAMITLHFSYGCGFLAGLRQLLPKRRQGAAPSGNGRLSSTRS